jgi:signal transduction histidine kinase
LYFETKNFKKAIELYETCYTVSKRGNHQQVLLDVSINLGALHFNFKEYNDAERYYMSALEISDKLNNREHKLNILKNLMHVYSEKKEYKKAVNHAKKYIRLQESIDQNFRETYVKMSEFEEEEKQNQLLKKDNEKKELYIYSLSSGFVLLVLLFFALFRINKQKQKVVLAEKNKELAQQRTQEKLRQQELAFTTKMLEQQEREQQRVAEDLHDRVGSLLSLVKIHLISLKKHVKISSNDAVDKFKKTNNIVDETCDEVRKIAYNMASSVLAKYGLKAALEELIDTLKEDDSLEVEFVTHGINKQLQDDLETCIYKIIQELINNIIKHAEANEISLQLIQSKEKINITLEDNGIGFNTENEKLYNNGMGLRNVQSRLLKVNGELLIDSAPRKGTTITINIPINT